MSHAIQSRSVCVTEPHPVRHFVTGLRGALRKMLQQLADSWRYSVARREFSRLDASALRDLGMSSTEFDSYWAETHGLAEHTRRRVTREGGRSES